MSIDNPPVFLTGELEAQPADRLHLLGFALRKQDSAVGPDIPELKHTSRLTLLNQVGHSPWIVGAATENVSWSDVINNIPGELYRIHMLEMNVDATKAAIEGSVRKVIDDLRNFHEDNRNLNISYQCDEGWLCIIFEDHLSPFWAGVVLQSIEEELGAIENCQT